ncbi:MAG: ABC transporter substrate-binding protein [bacterium]
MDGPGTNKARRRAKWPLRAGQTHFSHHNLWVTLVVLAGCAGTGPSPSGDTCALLPGDGGPAAEHLTVALVEGVYPDHAPRPANDSEAMVFRHVYEGLTDVDCHGVARPALAAVWATDDDGATWRFRLRGDARFADGAPVTASDVVEAWRAGRRSARNDPVRAALWRDLKLRDLSADGDVVGLRLEAPDPDLPRLLAASEFAIAKRGGAAWPVGTRGRTVDERYESGRRLLTCTDDSGRVVDFVVTVGADPRDVFPPDVDLLVSRQRRALEDLPAMTGARVTPLPWSRTYVVTASPAWPDGPPDDARRELADAILPSISRPAETPWLEPPGDAEARAPEPPPGPAPAGRVAQTLATPAEDPDAAFLAERLASRWGREGAAVIVVRRNATEIARSMGEATEPGVYALDRQLASVAHQARRLAALTPPGGPTPWSLVSTRAMLVSRNDLTGIWCAWDGVPRLDDVRRRPDVLP